MPADLSLNGADYLMLGFDHELRRQGYAGNSCQIVLTLDRPLDAAMLQARLKLLAQRHPILCARPGGVVQNQLDPVGYRLDGPRRAGTCRATRSDRKTE